MRRRGHFLFPYFAKNLRLCKVTVCKWLLKEKPRFFSPICRIGFYFFNSATIYVRKVDNNKKTVGMPLSPIKVLEIVVCCLAFSGFKEPHLHPSLPLLHLITCFFNDHHPHKSTPLSTRYLLTIPLTRLKHSSSPLRSFQSATGVLLTKLIGFLKTLIISNSDFIETSSELFSTSSELIRTSSELISTSAEVIHLLRRSISKPAKKRPRTFLPFLQSFHLPRISPFNRSGAKVCKIRVRSMIHNKQFSVFINHLRRFV